MDNKLYYVFVDNISVTMHPMNYAKACKIRDAIKAHADEYEKIDVSEAEND